VSQGNYMAMGMLPEDVMQDVRRDLRYRLPHSVVRALTMPFTADEVRQDAARPGDTFLPRYIPVPAIIRRLNDALGITGWSFCVNSWQVIPPSEVIVHARIEVHVNLATSPDNESYHTVRSTYDAFGQAMLKYDSTGQRYWDFGKDLKAATSDALRKAATLLGVGLHLYEQGESRFQGYQDVAQAGHVLPAQPFQIQQIRQLFAATGLREVDWCAMLGIPTPESMNAAIAAQILSGAHPVAIQYGISGRPLTPRDTL